MPVGLDTLSTVGFLTREDGTTLGSCFAVWIDSRDHGYLVTAAHVVDAEVDPQVVRFRHIDGSVHKHSVGGWVFHDEVDVAVTPLPTTAREQRHYAQSVDRQVLMVQHQAMPLLGTEVLYAGLFEPAVTDVEAFYPMVRSGTVGMLYTGLDAFERYRNPFAAHLIDCRSYGGFSGSPVWLHLAYPGPRVPDEPPQPWRQTDPQADEIGTMRYVAVLLGVFLEHYNNPQAKNLASNTGVGIVLPVEYVHGVLQKDELVTKRRAADDAKIKPEDAERNQARARQTGPVDRDERVSLYPLDAENALRALLDTPPDPKG